MKHREEWDYAIVATGGGEKLERWGEFYLLRPDPQAIWSSVSPLSDFRMLHGRYIRSREGGGSWEFYKTLPEEWTITYPMKSCKTSLKFIISPTNFKHTGLFPEQAINWERVHYLFKPLANKGKTPKILNLFGYTGGATVACAVAGAHVTHVDASKGMTDVCKRNVALNNIPDNKVRYIVEDCAKFVARELRRGNTYDGIIMDPPSFGRGANGEVWKIEQHLDDLVKLCCELLTDSPMFFLINSYTTGLQPTVIKNILLTNLRKTKKDGKIKLMEAYELTLPTHEGIDLPAGCSAMAIW